MVYQMMIKQKLFNIINPNFPKHVNIFSYPYMLFSEAKHFVTLSYLEQF